MWCRQLNLSSLIRRAARLQTRPSQRGQHQRDVDTCRTNPPPKYQSQKEMTVLMPCWNKQASQLDRTCYLEEESKAGQTTAFKSLYTAWQCSSLVCRNNCIWRHVQTQRGIKSTLYAAWQCSSLVCRNHWHTVLHVAPLRRPAFCCLLIYFSE